MTTKNERRQAFIRYYREVNKVAQVDMHEVARLAHKMGWALPKPADPLDELAKEFSAAAREEIDYDKVTGRPYRVNHAVTWHAGDKQGAFWFHIDHAPRRHMHKSLIQRREQMVGDGLQLSLDADHWNACHPKETAIEIPLDFTDDVEWRKNSADDKDKTG